MSETTMTVGEVMEALKGFDETDKLICFIRESKFKTMCLECGEYSESIIFSSKVSIEGIAKHGCRTVAIKVSDE